LSVLGLVPASAVAAAPQDAGYVAAIGAEPFDGGMTRSLAVLCVRVHELRRIPVESRGHVVF